MRYSFLVAANGLLGWARRLISDLNTRDSQIEQRLKDIEARLDAGGL